MIRCILTLLVLQISFIQIFIAQAKIKGNVYDAETNKGLNNVLIQLKNQGIKTTTDVNGFFEIETQNFNDFIIFSNKDFNKQTIKLSAYKLNYEIYLSKTEKALNEVVVTSSYTRPKRREEVVGSIATVSSKELQTNRPIESIDKMLQGLVPGLQVETNTELGTPVRINIRGQNSLTALTGTNAAPRSTSTQPLYIIDGVPITEARKGAEPIAFISSETLLNPIANINPDDIETISVLKDAAATSIYGANANNGVIIITTKKGLRKGTSFTGSYQTGMARSINRMKWTSGPEFHDLLKELYLNEGQSPLNAALLAGSNSIDTKWFELLNRYSSFINADLGLSAGNENTQVRFTTSFYNQNAIQKKNYLQKIYSRLRVDHSVSKNMNLSITLAPTFTQKSGLNTYNNVPIMPNIPVYNADGSFYELSNLLVPNPIAVLNQNIDLHNGASLNGNIGADYSITKNLKLITKFGIDALTNRYQTYESALNATGRTKNGFASIFNRQEFSWVQFTQLNWIPKIGLKNSFDVTTGYEIQSAETNLLKGTGSGFSYYRLNELSNAANQTSASSKQKRNGYSLYAQAQYAYDGKLFVSLSGRRDESSVFGTDVNSTINGAVGLGYILSREKLFRNAKWVDLFRVRASYGSTGNSRISGYEAAGLYNFNDIGYNGAVAAFPISKPNPDLTWEKGLKTNIGIDFNFLKYFDFTFDWYNNLTKDAISSINIDPASGFTNMLANIADLQNRGWDAQIRSNWLNKKITCNTTLNFGFNKGVVKKVKDNLERYSSTEQASVLRAGVSTTAIWGFQFLGVNPATGEEIFRDKNKVSTPVSQLALGAENAYYLGDRLPKLQGGITHNIAYKKINLSFQFLFELGGNFMVSRNQAFNVRNLNNANQSRNLLKRWQKPGDITDIPKLDRRIRQAFNSSRFMYNRTHLKLNNISLGYEFSKGDFPFLKKISGTTFINATNLWYWYKDKSPKGFNGIKEYRFIFPEAQSITVGANIKL